MEMERGKQFFREVLPFTAMVAIECVTVGLNTLFKAATLRGMSYHVFMVYRYAIASLLLLPSPFFSRRSADLPPLNFSVICKISLLGLVGGTSQIMGAAGILFSSPTLSSAMSNLTPALTFLLAIIFRMEILALRSSSSQAKVLGTIVSIAGALVVTLYKGPPILFSGSSNSVHQPLHSPQSSWVFGSLFLTTEYTLVTIWYIILAQIMKECPAELTVMFFYNLCVLILCTVVGLITEPNGNAWRIRLDITLASIVCSGLFGSLLTNVVHAWVLRIKGPVYAAMFKPLSIVIALAMGVLLLGDTLYVGSLTGATIISAGFYTVMWGKAKEQQVEDSESESLGSLSTQKDPLLRSNKVQETSRSVRKTPVQ